MTSHPVPCHEAIIIGGGFYGSAIAIHLARQRGFKRIVLLEREGGLLRRASYNNQARVHNGYHYPRSFTTAYRSRVNLPRFALEAEISRLNCTYTSYFYVYNAQLIRVHCPLDAQL